MATRIDTLTTDEQLRFDIPHSVGMARISIAAVDGDRERCKEVAGLLAGPRTGTIRDVPGYLPTIEDARWLSDQGFDLIFVGVDSNPRTALRTVESLCTLTQSTIVVYSERIDQDLLIQAMRAGAREFLPYPFVSGALDEVKERAAVRLQAAPVPKKTAGKAYVFVGAKGGAGVTTVASNFAVAMAQNAKQNTLLIDLDLPLGDAALDLGLTCQYSTVDALREAERLDAAFLPRLLVHHNSGLSLLAAPGRFPHVDIDDAAVDKLLTVACNNFDCVVIDAGSRLDWTRTQLFDIATRIYLVTQVGIPELRNSNRMITGSIPAYGEKLEIVLNRYAPKMMGIDDVAIARALTKEPQWRVPNDYLAVREMQNRAEPFALDNSPIARTIRKMAREACGLPEDTKKKGLLSFFK